MNKFSRLLLLTVLLFMQAKQAAIADEEAMPSKKAPRSLLLDVAQAGKRLVAVGERGHVVYSDDQGKSWKQAKVPSVAMLTAVYFSDEKNGWAVGHDTKILTTEDGGITWTKQYQSEDSHDSKPLLDVWFKDKNVGFAVGAYGTVLHTEDGGKNWDDWADHLQNEEQMHYNGIAGRSDGTLFIVGEQGLILRSTDNGETWKKLNSPYEGSFFGVLATKKTGSVFIYGLQGHLYHSTNNGDSWERIKTGISSGLMNGAQLPDDSILITGNAGNVLRAADENAGFKLITRPDRQAVLSVASSGASWIVAVGEGGIKLIAPDGSSPELH